jgi:YVTN family beta-propeller protein/VCBS repeat-containing protein
MEQNRVRCFTRFFMLLAFLGCVLTARAAANNPPVANPNAYTVAEDKTLTTTATTGVLANDTDAEANPLTAALVTGVSNGTLTLNANGSFSYKPKSNFNGTDSFTYKASDGNSQSNVATVTITVTAVNDAPIATAQTADTLKDTPKQITLVATDAEGDPLTYTVVTQPTYGTLSGSGANRTYTPAAGYVGSDSFTFRATDPAGANSATATFSLGVNQLDTNITAANDSYVASNPYQKIGATKGVLINDKDALGRALASVLEAAPANGTVKLLTTGEFTYTPNPGYYGSDSFSYRAKNGSLVSAPATVSLTVQYVVKTVESVPIKAIVANPVTKEYVKLDGSVQHTGTTTWNYRGTYPVWYWSQHTTFTGTAIGLTSGVSYTATVFNEKHDEHTPPPPFDWNRIRPISLKHPTLGKTASLMFTHTVRVNADGTTTSPPILSGSFYNRQSETTPSWAYVTNPTADTVTVVDVNKVVKTIAVGDAPDGVAAAPLSDYVYVANSGSGTVSVIQAATNSVVATVAVGGAPRRVAVNPLGTRLYVTDTASNSVSVIDTATNSVVATFGAATGYPASAPGAVAVDYLGERLFVADAGSQSVAVLDAATGSLLASLPLAHAPGDLAVRPGGGLLAVTLPALGAVTLFDTADHSLRGIVAAGINPQGVAFAAPGDWLYVANSGSNSISVIDTNNNTIIKTILQGVGANPTGIQAANSGKALYVTNSGANTLSLVKVSTVHVVTVLNSVSGSYPAGPAPSRVALLF